jgi:hypothetical protein
MRVVFIIIMLPNQAIASTPSAPRPSGARCFVLFCALIYYCARLQVMCTWAATADEECWRLLHFEALMWCIVCKHDCHWPSRLCSCQVLIEWVGNYGILWNKLMTKVSRYAGAVGSGCSAAEIAACSVNTATCLTPAAQPTMPSKPVVLLLCEDQPGKVRNLRAEHAECIYKKLLSCCVEEASRFSALASDVAVSTEGSARSESAVP